MSMKLFDKVFGVLLLVASMLHAYGSMSSYKFGSQELVWALSGSLAGGLTAAINLLRSDRPEDATLAWVAFVASIGWGAVAIGFGAAIGNLIVARDLRAGAGGVQCADAPRPPPGPTGPANFRALHD